jgi:hypothetical protein
MKNIRKFLTVACLCLISAELSGQNGRLAINLRPLESTTGSTKEIELTLSNQSGQDLFFPCSDVSMIRILVYKANGSLAHNTAKGLQLKDEQRKARSSKSVCVSDTLKQGQSVKQTIDVGSLYEMNSAGTYHMTAELDMQDGTTARSSQIALEVK